MGHREGLLRFVVQLSISPLTGGVTFGVVTLYPPPFGMGTGGHYNNNQLIGESQGVVSPYRTTTYGVTPLREPPPLRVLFGSILIPDPLVENGVWGSVTQSVTDTPKGRSIILRMIKRPRVKNTFRAGAWCAWGALTNDRTPTTRRTRAGAGGRFA